jgi:hypothetical protein
MSRPRVTYTVDENGDMYCLGSGVTRFTALDAHKLRVKIKANHPEHPTLTAYALSILFPDEAKPEVEEEENDTDLG